MPLRALEAELTARRKSSRKGSLFCSPAAGKSSRQDSYFFACCCCCSFSVLMFPASSSPRRTPRTHSFVFKDVKKCLPPPPPTLQHPVSWNTVSLSRPPGFPCLALEVAAKAPSPEQTGPRAPPFSGTSTIEKTPQTVKPPGFLWSSVNSQRCQN